MKYFLAYYIISGVIMSIVVYVHRKDMYKTMNIPSIIKPDALVLFNFLIGFIQFPFWIPLELRRYYLRRKIKKLEDKK